MLHATSHFCEETAKTNGNASPSPPANRHHNFIVLLLICYFVNCSWLFMFSIFITQNGMTNDFRLCSIKPGYWKTKKLQSIHGLPQKRKKRTCFHWMNAQVYEWRAGNTIGILLCVKYCRPKPFHITMLAIMDRIFFWK